MALIYRVLQCDTGIAKLLVFFCTLVTNPDAIVKGWGGGCRRSE